MENKMDRRAYAVMEEEMENLSVALLEGCFSFMRGIRGEWAWDVMGPITLCDEVMFLGSSPERLERMGVRNEED